MNGPYFFAQDLSGNMQKVHRVMAGHAATRDPAKPMPRAYALDDGTPVRRIDNDTFQIMDTGALVTLLRD